MKVQLLRIFQNSSLVAVLVSSATAHSWGRLGHELVVELGAHFAHESQFFINNVEALKILTNVPDSVWKSGAYRSQESYNHWFQPDAYASDPTDFKNFPRQYTEALALHGLQTLRINGTAPWRILQTYEQMLESLRTRDWVRALQMAGVMSHYIGDLSQPLHVTQNYDGQHTDQKGIHAYFESTNLSKIARADLFEKINLKTSALLADPKFRAQFKGRIVDIAFAQITRSFREYDKLLQNDKRFGRGNAGSVSQLELASDRMADGAATLALVLDRAWHESQLGPQPAVSVMVPTPAYLQASFYDEVPSARRALEAQFAAPHTMLHGLDTHDDDCLAP